MNLLIYINLLMNYFINEVEFSYVLVRKRKKSSAVRNPVKFTRSSFVYSFNVAVIHSIT